jgi:DNA-binding MarR family transcriptional regulator
MKLDFRRRFGFLVSDVARLYGQQFDRAAREQLGLSAMAVGSLCDRMASAGWIRREAHATDRRINVLQLEPRAAKALAKAMEIGDALSAKALGGLSAAERAQLLALLARARDALMNEKTA